MEVSKRQIDAICDHFENVESYEKEVRNMDFTEKNEPSKPNATSFGKSWVRNAHHLIDVGQAVASLPSYFHVDKKSLEILREMRNSYDQKSQVIAQRAFEVSQLLLNYEHARSEAYQRYEEAGTHLRDAYNRKDPKIKKIREKFENKQRDAIKTHESYNDQLIKTTEKIERIMTDFENIEQYRLTSIKAFFTNLTFQLKQKIDSFGTNDDVETDDIVHELNKHMSCPANEHKTKGKSMSCDPEFAPSALDKIVGKFMNLEEYFKKEIAEGGCIVRATKKYKGGYDELDVEEDELLCHISVFDSTKSLCKNINQLIGFVPNDYLVDV